MRHTLLLAAAMLALITGTARAEDGYDLWLRYHRVSDAARSSSIRASSKRPSLFSKSPRTLGSRW